MRNIFKFWIYLLR